MSSILTVTLNPAVDISGETDAVHHTRKVRMSGDRYDPGGGGINVARIVSLFGGDTEALFLAGGEMGSLLGRLVEERGVRHKAFPLKGQTRVSFTVRERNAGQEFRFVLAGPTVEASEVEPCLDHISSHEADYVVASGSLPEGCSPDIYAEMAERTAARGARFILDSSGDGLRATLERTPVFLVKPSLGEFEVFVGRKLDEENVRRAASDLVARGAAQIVAVTMGMEGAVLASADGTLRLPAIHVRERSAVGAGDSFLGAMVWALSSGWTTTEAFKFGAAAGAAAIMTPGTELCRREDTLELYRRAEAE
ncbi:MAG: 1-phosphofructokinase family hexose kinase [Rhizobiaceae bacterium]